MSAEFETLNATESSLREGVFVAPNVRSGQTRLSIFTIPKPFVGSIKLAQYNAIRSWQRACPGLEIILLGDEPGIAEAAADLNVRQIENLKKNQVGTPLLSSAFRQANEQAWGDILIYCNCDVILWDDFFKGIGQIVAQEAGPFLAIGRRTDLKIESAVDFNDPTTKRTFEKKCSQLGELSSIMCKEYFVFRRGQFAEIPDFAVGRGNWDNWMVYQAKRAGVPVVDLSTVATVIHQTHDYRHLGGQTVGRAAPSDLIRPLPSNPSVSNKKKNRWQCYVAGAEAKENQRLAGGRHLIRGSTATWKLDGTNLKRKWFTWANLDFWLDIGPLYRLLRQFLKGQ